MNIALLGYGKMGREVELAAQEREHTVVARIDAADRFDSEVLKESGADVAIDFAFPGVVLEHAKTAAASGVPMVIGTTGWESDLAAVKAAFSTTKVGCIAASNFSIGVNLFFEIVQDAARLLGSADYDAYIVEAHHNKKKDFPSGTALRLGEAMLKSMDSKKRIVSELVQGEPIAPDAIMISSVRAGTIMGNHRVGFDSEVDTIELIHNAKSRKGFAMGAVRAAEWIVGRQGFYRFEDCIREVLGLQV